MVEESRNGVWYSAICEVCRKDYTGYQSVSFIIYNFAKEHEDTCRIKHDCLR